MRTVDKEEGEMRDEGDLARTHSVKVGGRAGKRTATVEPVLSSFLTDADLQFYIMWSGVFLWRAFYWRRLAF